MTPHPPDALASATPAPSGAPPFVRGDAVRTGAAVARAVPRRAPVRTVAVAGAKGGVGKSVIAANLAVALGRAGHRVLLFDADLALGDAARLLGAVRRGDLCDVLDGRAGLDDLVVAGPPGVSVIPSSDGDPRLSHLSRMDQASLVALFGEMDTTADILLVDTPSGLSDAALCPAGAAREVLVVTGPEPAALDDAAALVHALATRYRTHRFRVLANGTRCASHGLDVYAALAARVDPGADLLLDHAGTVPHDSKLVEAIVRGTSVMEAFPGAPSALAFGRLAARVARWPRPTTPAGHIEYFVERLIQAAGPHLARATTA